MSRIAVALSGGGHRASLFGLGVLMYLSDADQSKDVISIASVSGGSITNAFLAQQLDYAQAPKKRFEEEVAGKLAQQVAQRGTLLAPFGTKVYIVLVALVLSLVLVSMVVVSHGWRTVGARVGGILVLAWLAGQRGNVCGAAYKKTLFTKNGRATVLAEIASSVHHVICATDLRTGRHVCFAPDFVYGYGFGWAKPKALTLSKAVQASSAFPGGFPPTVVSTSKLSFVDTLTGKPMVMVTDRLVLADGGVYDNMADQWARGFASRGDRWPQLKHDHDEPDTLIVVNASARKEWMPLGRQLPLFGEVAVLLRDMSVLYENTTAVRRQDLVSSFDAAEATGTGMRGTLVMINQSPPRLASYFAKTASAQWPARAARAEAVLRLLGADSAGRWQQTTDLNCNVPTTLSALGTETSARLLHHAYVLAMCNLHVVLDFPLLAMPTLARFEALAANGIPLSTDIPTESDPI